MAAAVAVAVAAGLGAYVWSTRFATDIPGFQPLAEFQPLLPALGLALDAIQRIEIVAGPAATTLYRAENGWHVEQKSG